MGERAVTDAPAETINRGIPDTDVAGELDTDESPKTGRKLEVDTVYAGVIDSDDDKGAALSNPGPLLRRWHSNFFCHMSKQSKLSP